MIIKISVIVPIYNVEKYLEECVQSILNQTLKEIEIILVNDGSTDSSKKIAELFCKMDSRIVLINQDNKGLSTARNTGIKVARGEYISFIDSDDWIEKDMYEKLYNIAKNNICDIVICNHTLKYENKNLEKIYDITPNRVLNEIDIKNEIKTGIIRGSLNTTCWDKIYKRELFRENITTFKDIPRFEDLYFFIDIISYTKTIFYYKESLYNYRVVEDSLSRKKYENYEDIILELHRYKYNVVHNWDMNSKSNNNLLSANFFEDILKTINIIYSDKDLNRKSKVKKFKKFSNSMVKKSINTNNINNYNKLTGNNKLYVKFVLYMIKRNLWNILYVFLKAYNNLLKFK